MGNCCPKDDTDTNASQGRANQNKSPNSKTRNRKQPPEVNPFKPGPRDVRIVTNEDTGKLEKTHYKPPSDPEAYAAQK